MLNNVKYQAINQPEQLIGLPQFDMNLMLNTFWNMSDSDWSVVVFYLYIDLKLTV